MAALHGQFYTIGCDMRDDLANHLQKHGVPTWIYYPAALRRQTTYRKYHHQDSEPTNSDALAETVLSLPTRPYLGISQEDYIIDKM